MPHRRSARLRSRIAVGVALVVSALVVMSGLWTPAHAAGTVYYVSPTGADTNTGTSATAPFKTIQRALNLAQPGTTINLAAGTYKEAVATKVAGTAAAPITVRGPETGKAVSGRYKAVLVSPAGRAFSINHSYYTLDGFTIDGQPNIDRTAYPSVTSLSQIRAFKDSVQAQAVNSKLVYVGADTTVADIVGTTISNMFLSGSGGECVRFRDRAANSLVDNSVIQWCGMLGQGDDVSQYKYHNAEGVYIGTSTKSTDQPMFANDTSNNAVVRNSTINTFGSECFEVKENAHHNRLENTDCGFNDEPANFQGSNVELRGDHNTVLSSRLSQSRSWNLKLASDSATYDRGGNTGQKTAFSGAATYAIVNRQTGSGPFCSDTFTGSVSDPSGNGIGTPTAACADTTAPTAPAGLTAKASSATSVALTWTAATDDVGVTSYLVRRNNVQIGTSSTTSYTDSTATASTTYSYTVVARDAAGNLSPASAPASVTTPAAQTAQVIAVEAESGVLTAPMAAVTDSTAQGGKYVAQTSGTSAGKDTVTVNVPVAGRYALALRVKAANTSSDTITYAVDTGAATTWNLGTRASWTWVTGPTVTLTAGTHKIILSKKENGTRIDALRLTPA
jgi:chitodextrinase